ncbi:MAG TPA: HAD-IIIA family hydrolase [candidate division Zixibacteria bacterium]|nr:HAD-IIIA family hydrolase [candidate division Zixibacteria bacterium]
MSKKILVIRFGSLGDLILTSAPILNLHVSYPTYEIALLTKERFMGTAMGIGAVDRIHILPEKASFWQYLGLLRRLSKEQFDLIVDLHGNQRSWLARKLIKANTKVVYPKRRLERVVATRKGVVLPKSWPHTIDLYNDAVKQAGGRTPAFRPVFDLSRFNVSDPVLFAGEAGGPLIAIAPGAAHPTKQWPMERFERLAELLGEKLNARIAWLVQAQDQGKQRLAECLGPDRFIEIVDAGIPKLAEFISRCDLTVANDSGLAHLSSAVGTPVMAIFGPTHPVLGFAPRGQFDQIIEVDEACRPCSLHGKKPCYRERRFCMERIEPEAVLRRAAELLAERKDLQPALFIDRDGTLIVDKDYLSDPEGVELIPGAVEALKKARAAGYKLVVVSNQSGVARGMFDIAAVEAVNRRLLEILTQARVDVAAVYYCPHYEEGKVPEYAVKCGCRKPAPGMPEEAALQLGLDLRRSCVIGDKLDDIFLASVIGSGAILVRTGYGTESETKATALTRPVTICDDLKAAVDKICSGE